MTVTIYDVARAAGVGIGAVSRVLNNKLAVKDTTRQPVLETIFRFNYTPSPVARSMKAGRTGSIGLIIPFFTRPFATEVLRGIKAARRLGLGGPGDLSVIGFDGIEASQWLELTTYSTTNADNGRTWRSKTTGSARKPLATTGIYPIGNPAN